MNTARRANEQENAAAENRSVMMLVQPSDLNDALQIGDHIRGGNCVLVNLEQTDENQSRRILDFLRGFVYSCNGSYEKMSQKMYLFTPYGVELSGDFFHNMDE